MGTEYSLDMLNSGAFGHWEGDSQLSGRRLEFKRKIWVGDRKTSLRSVN